MFRIKLCRCIPPLLLIIALLFPAAAFAASPVGEFSGAAAVELNRNIPALSPENAAGGDFITCSELDALGRPGAVNACLSRATLSTELRSDSAPLPVGWVMTRYTDAAGSEQYLYRVCSLLSPSLGGNASDPRNVFTGTRTLRDEGMQPYVDKVAGYLSRTANHVLYRVTPAYNGDDLVPFGVQMEALSVEDAGRTIHFNVFLYNVEPGFSINYLTGESDQNGMTAIEQSAQALLNQHNYPAPTAITAPKYGTFEALYEAFINSSNASHTQSSSSLSIPRRAWAVKNDPNDRKFHKTETCSNTNNPTAYVLESVVKALEPCEACWTPEEYNYLMAVHNGTATLSTSSAQPQSTAASAGNTQTQSASSAAQNTTSTPLPTSTPSQSAAPTPLPTPAPSQSAAPTPLPTPAPSQKPNLLSLGSSLLSSALSPDTSMVWISTAEKVYHSREDCSNLDALFAYQKTLDWANAHGYEPCPDCW